MTKCEHCEGMGREEYTLDNGGISTMTCQHCEGLGRK